MNTTKLQRIKYHNKIIKENKKFLRKIRNLRMIHVELKDLSHDILYNDPFVFKEIDSLAGHEDSFGE